MRSIELAPESEKQMTYDDAVLYCTFCMHNGHSDWRMATHNEYRSTVVTGWFVDRNSSLFLRVTPVRDV